MSIPVTHGDTQFFHYTSLLISANYISNESKQNITELKRTGKDTEAVRLLRDATSMSLLETKEYFDKICTAQALILPILSYLHISPYLYHRFTFSSTNSVKFALNILNFYLKNKAPIIKALYLGFSLTF